MKYINFKNKILKNTIVLLITSLIIRALGLLNRIILTRLLGEQGISLYSLILPTIMLFLSLSCFSLNSAMIKISAKYKSKKVIKIGITIATITSSISSLILLLILKILTSKLLNQPITYYPILFSIPLFYLTSISTVLRGYLTGLERMSSTSIANLLEQISRIIFILLIFYCKNNKSIVVYVIFCIIAMSIGELISIFFSLINIKKINQNNLIIKKEVEKDLLEIAIPSTLNSLTSNLTFFLEPIIYTFILSKLLFTPNDILLKYSEVTAYALPLITLFSFISISISTAIMPKISTASNIEIKNFISKIIVLCLLPAILISTILFNYSTEISQVLYGTTIGSNLVKKYVWFFIFFYLIQPFNTILLSTNQSKIVFIISLIIHIIKLLIILIFPIFNNDALIISYFISYFLTFFIEYIILYKKYKFKINLKTLINIFFITIIINCLSFILIYFNIHFLIQIIIISIIYLILTFIFIKRNNI